MDPVRSAPAKLEDYKQAAAWYRKAADQGDALGQNNIGFMYQRGQGVPQDYSAALSWYRLAADQGHAHAQNNLGWMYFRGLGVPKDDVQAYMWFNLAVPAFPESEKEDRDHATNNRDMVAAKMTSGQIAQAQTMSER